jgi:pimeloyl-ACP methyl ester carboxylesterase
MTPAMRSACVACVLVFVLAVAWPAAAQWKSVETVALKGSYGLIIIPENWNGGLFIYAHGYSADQRLVAPFPSDLTPDTFLSKVNVLFQASLIPTLNGYASATTTFRSAGWYVKDSIKDIENLRRYFVKKHGKPTHTYLWGHSGGGMVTSTVIEYFPDNYDGALPLCGTTAGARRNFDGALDLRLLYEYTCGQVPGAQFACRVCSDGTSRCLTDADCGGGTCGDPESPAPPEDGLGRECTEFLLAHPETFSGSPTATDLGGDFVSPPVTACFGDLSGTIPATAGQLARRDFFVRASRISESFILTDMFFGTIGMAEIVHRRTAGKHPWSNVGVRYDSPLLTADERAALDAGVRRVTADAPAVRYMRRYYEPTGRTRSKVLTVHAHDDGLVLVENEDKYREAFEAARNTDRLVQLYTPYGGHCGFVAEIFPAVSAITAWVERNEKPSLPSVRAACPTCNFSDVLPGPWGLKVPERTQRGAPVGTLVCADEPNDCPPDATCGSKHRCQHAR